MECMNDYCDNELTGRQRTFCSDKCRKQASRPKSDKKVLNYPLKSDKVRVEPKSDKKSPVVDAPFTCPDDYEELMAGLPSSLRIVDSSPDWKRAESYKDMIRHLKCTSLTELQTQGAWIPCWRYSMDKVA